MKITIPDEWVTRKAEEEAGCEAGCEVGAATCCEPGDHIFEMIGPAPWSCAICGYTPKL